MRGFAFTACILAFAGAAQAADRASAKAALRAAVRQEDEAGKSGNRWLPAEAALRAARTALAAGQWDEAQAQADRAGELAARAVEQSREQETAWRDAVIR